MQCQFCLKLKEFSACSCKTDEGLADRTKKHNKILLDHGMSSRGIYIHRFNRVESFIS